MVLSGFEKLIVLSFFSHAPRSYEIGEFEAPRADVSKVSWHYEIQHEHCIVRLDFYDFMRTIEYGNKPLSLWMKRMVF